MALEFRPGIRSIVRPSAFCDTLACVCGCVEFRVWREVNGEQKELQRLYRVFVEMIGDGSKAIVRDVVPAGGGKPAPVKNGIAGKAILKEFICARCEKKLLTEHGIISGSAAPDLVAPSRFEKPLH